jgi:hypothetical protein
MVSALLFYTAHRRRVGKDLGVALFEQINRKESRLWANTIFSD